MKDAWFAGLDVSTQSCKLVIVDEKAKIVRHVEIVNYDRDLPGYGTFAGVAKGLPPGCSESDPGMWIDAVCAVFERTRKAGIRLEPVRCLSVSGQQHGLVGLDLSGNLTRPRSKLWNDFSTLEECRLLTDAVGGPEAMIREVGNTQRTGYTASKIYHMKRHEPEIFKKTATFFLVHNYINWFLTGGSKGGIRVMEPGDTSGMALWNPANRQWSSKVIDAINPALVSKLPPIQPSDRSIGRISPDLVKIFGFSEDCRIDAGSGDNMYGAIGTGNVLPGIVTVSLGTSGTAYTFLKSPYIDPDGEIAAFCDSTGHSLPLLCVSNLANGYEAFLSQFGLDHDGFNRIAGKIQADFSGQILVPWFSGERTPDLPLGAPLWFGFGISDMTPEIIGHAVLEGHIMNIHDAFQRMPVSLKEIRLTGGLSRSEAWCQTIANVFECETVPVEGEGAALGAALHAAWVWGKESGKPKHITSVVEPFVVFNQKHRKKPMAKCMETMRLKKRLFSALSRRLRGKTAEDPFLLRHELMQKTRKAE